ncbi:MAG TPA: hypothetical protein VFW98_08835 [Gemmatimonadaceae bacterium]|nr:hypothetical protein [Gemmatimonadaceae bacterium]
MVQSRGGRDANGICTSPGRRTASHAPTLDAAIVPHLVETGGYGCLVGSNVPGDDGLDKTTRRARGCGTEKRRKKNR